MSEFKAALAGGLIASVVGVVAQYIITYKLIEQPKLDLEKKRISIEAQKQILSFTPTSTSTCSARRLDKLTWRIDCLNKNSGTYSITAGVEKAEITFEGDQKEGSFESGEIFTVEFPNNHRKHIVSPGTSGNITFYIKFSKEHFPKEEQTPNLFAIVQFKYEALNSTRQFIESSFPEAKSLIDEVSTFQERIWTKLPLSY